MDRSIFSLAFICFVLLVSFGPALGQELPNAPGARVGNEMAFRKTLHIVGGFAISNMVGLASNRPWAGLAAGIGAGVAKEVHDHSIGGRFSARDVAITSAGAFAGYALNKWVFHVGRKAPGLDYGFAAKP